MLGRLLIAITACHALITPRLLVQRAPALKSTVADAVNKGKRKRARSRLKTAYPVASAATTLAWTACAMQALGTHPSSNLAASPHAAHDRASARPAAAALGVLRRAEGCCRSGLVTPPIRHLPPTQFSVMRVVVVARVGVLVRPGVHGRHHGHLRV